jgi:hypothetical protein
MSRILAICLVLVMASVSLADTVIGNWETGNDGWTVDGGDVYSGQTVGVTLGTSSAGLDMPQGAYWDVHASGLDPALFVGATKVTMDLTLIATEWQVNWNWLAVDKMAVQSDATASGWVEEAVTWTDRTTGLPIAANWGPWNPDVAATLTWNLTGLDLTGATYVNLVFAFQNPNAPATGLFYVDNAKIVNVPEPATMALLGLGGLALIRRKK